MLEAARKLGRITGSAVIAGGYPRDAVIGATPKDIDIFLDTRYWQTPDRQQDIADRIYDTFGQIGARPGTPEERNTYASQGDASFETYQMLTTDREWQPVNLIFSRGNEKLNHFDWSICRFFVVDGRFDYLVADANPLNNHYLPMRSQSPERALEHAKRIKAKYPQARFRIPANTILQHLDLYRAIGIWEGFIEQQDIPAETQSATGNQVRFGLGVQTRPDTATTGTFDEWSNRFESNAPAAPAALWAQQVLGETRRVVPNQRAEANRRATRRAETSYFERVQEFLQQNPPEQLNWSDINIIPQRQG